MELLVQTPGDYNYPGLNKPVFFSTSFLASLARKGKYGIVDEHEGPRIGKATEAIFKEGGLWIVTDDEFDTAGRGFSTSIKNYVLKDLGDRYEILEGDLDTVARTRDPKDMSTFLYNSKTPDDDDKHQEGNNGGNTLSDEDKKEIERLNQQVGALKTEVNGLVTERDNLKEQITTLEGEKNDLETTIQERDTTIQEKDNKLQAIEDEAKLESEALAKELAGEDEELLEVYKGTEPEKLRTLLKKSTKPLIKELAGDDEDLQKAIGSLSKNQLEILKEKGFNTPDTGHNGVGDATGNDQNNGNDDQNNDPPQSHEDWKKDRGIW